MAEASSQDCGVMGHDDSSTPHLADATVSTTAQEELATPQSAGTRPSPSAEEEPVLPTNGLTSRPWRMPSKGAGEGKIGSPPVNLGLDRQPIQTSPFKSLRRIWRIHGTLVRLIFFSLFPIIQVFVICIVLVLSATMLRVDSELGQMEWDQGKQLGICAAIWAARTAVVACIRICELWRVLDKAPRPISRAEDLETSLGSSNANLEPDSDRSQPANLSSEPGASSTASPSPTQGDSSLPLRTRSPQRRSQPIDWRYAFDHPDMSLQVITVIHLVVNQIFLFTSLSTCRFTAPHLWWMAFGIACIGYLAVLEMLIAVLLVFVVGPTILLFVKLLMLCMGRHVDCYGNVRMPREIPTMDPNWIENIPLVVYVPPKSEDAENDESHDALEESSPGSTATSGRFNFFRRGWKFIKREKPKKVKPSPTAATSAFVPPGGDIRFEPVDYPLVTLERNRASCPICLTDFVEPKRRSRANQERPQKRATAPAENISSVESTESAGVPGEPLRMLACGHVFHTQCVDPWLSNVAGRCPVCSRKVKPDTSSPSAHQAHSADLAASPFRTRWFTSGNGGGESSEAQTCVDTDCSSRVVLRVTPYRLAGTCFSIVGGVVLKVVVCWNPDLGPFPFNTVDWVIGGAVGLLLTWVGFIEPASTGFWHWFLCEDYSNCIVAAVRWPFELYKKVLRGRKQRLA